jgi:hypothetical protein
VAKNKANKKQSQSGASNGFPEEKIVLRMLRKNVPLSQWRQFVDSGDGYGFFSSKNADKVAQSIFSQLSHPEAVKIVAHEWGDLGPDVRVQLGTLASKGNATGNVTKGCQELNRLIGGKLLAEKKEITTTINGKKISVNPAIAGASRKYQNLDTPGYGVRHLAR